MTTEIYICKARNGEEIDGFEKHTDDIYELLKLLKQFKEAHIQTLDESIDLWVELK